MSVLSSYCEFPKLTESERDSCEGSLTKTEIWEGLNSMANNKSPGNDGLSKEFYVCFLNEIHTYLLNTLNCFFFLWSHDYFTKASNDNFNRKQR